jgi:hypothetical protein
MLVLINHNVNKKDAVGYNHPKVIFLGVSTVNLLTNVGNLILKVLLVQDLLNNNTINYMKIS